MEGIYCGPPSAPETIWMRWNLDPYMLAALVPAFAIAGRGRSWTRLQGLEA